MNYLNIYKKLILKRKLEEAFENVEKHHILPKSLFPEKAKDKNNLVKLTYREHYIAHHLLYLYYKKIDDKNAAHKMANTWFRMCKNNDGLHVSSYEFEKAKIAAMNENKNFHFKHSEETKKLISLHNANKNGLSEEHKKKIGNANKGKKHSIEQNEGHSKKMKEFYSHNSVWNKGLTSSNESKEKNRASHLGRIFINNGTINKTIFKWEEIPLGFSKGRI